MIYVVTLVASIITGALALGGEKNKIKEIEKKIQSFEGQFKVPQISAEELKNILTREDVVLVDVRQEKEQKVSMIPGALTEKEFRRRRGEMKGKTVVAYCTIGYRSSKFIKSLVGSPDALKLRNLRGSLLLWAHAGGPLVNESGQIVKNVHVYGKAWDLLPDGYKGVYD